MKEISYKNILDLDNKYKEQLRNWRNQDFVREKMLNMHIVSKKEHEKFLCEIRENKDKIIYIAFNEKNPIGVIVYDYFNSENQVEFGFYLTHKKYLNGGYGIILEYSFLDYIFNKTKIKKVFCRTKNENRKVVSLHSKFGFEKNNEKSNEEICYQEIDKEKWDEKRDIIENLIRYIIDLDCINELY